VLQKGRERSNTSISTNKNVMTNNSNSGEKRNSNQYDNFKQNNFDYNNNGNSVKLPKFNPLCSIGQGLGYVSNNKNGFGIFNKFDDQNLFNHPQASNKFYGSNNNTTYDK